ncbi:energy transducer TonB [Sphingomonas turrisvirgatae]|nr:energy transducer TonB [Sphingomonas turrisvirgatae]
MALSSPRERIGGAAAALGVTGILGAVLVLGLAVHGGLVKPDGEVTLFDVLPEPPKPKPKSERMKQRNTRPSGAAAPPNLKSRATEVQVPRPIVPIVVPPPLPIAEKAADGAQATSGAALVAGPGTGAGGIGDGFGGGGDGDGDGAGDRDATPPRQIRGRISNRDYPENLSEAGIGGRVTVLYLVETDGRVAECDVVGSSGNRQLDNWTCQLIRERFRFRPSLNDRGRPVPALVRENHYWQTWREPADR